MQPITTIPRDDITVAMKRDVLVREKISRKKHLPPWVFIINTVGQHLYFLSKP